MTDVSELILIAGACGTVAGVVAASVSSALLAKMKAQTDFQDEAIGASWRVTADRDPKWGEDIKKHSPKAYRHYIEQKNGNGVSK